MYLKEIQLENFKSFGRKIRIPFLKGFTAITGPNGSGKSNVSDAILFVLGPKSPRVIRAGKLTDLIFNGGKDKKPSKFTKVSLVFDNTDRVIPHDDDEVILTRLVKISPSNKDKYLSYFYVNGRSSQMTHFQMLLDHARISAEGYNIVQQGDVTKMVTMGNVERRRIFDTLAGITQYDDDINKAQNQQKHVEGNIEKVDIILNELDMDLKKLKKERNEAMKYKELKDLREECVVKLEYKKCQELRVELTAVNNNIARFEEKEVELRDKIDAAKRDRAENEDKLRVLEDEIAERGGDEAKELREKITHFRLEIARGKDAISNCNDKILETQEGMSVVKGSLDSGSKERKKIQDEVGSSQKKLDKVTSTYDKVSKQLADIEGKISKSNSEIMRLQKEDLSIKQSIEKTRDEIHAKELEVDRHNHTLESLDGDMARLEEDIGLKTIEVKDAEYMIKTLSAEMKGKSTGSKPLKEVQAEFQKKKNRESKLSQESRELEAVIDRLSREYQRMKTERIVMEKAQKGYTQGVEMIMQAKNRGEISGIIGTIAELANVDKEYETALSVVAGRRMQAVVVKDDEVAAQCISYLKKNRGGLATFLPLNKLRGGRPQAKALMAVKHHNSLGFAIDLIDFNEKYYNAFYYVFQDSIVMKNLDSAREIMGGVMLVTLSGDVIDPRGGMSGGHRAKQKLSFGKQAESDFETKEEELNKAERAAQEVSDNLMQLREDLDALERELKDRQGQEGEMETEIDKHRARLKEFTTKVQSLEKEKEAQNEKMNKVRETIAKCKEEIQGLGGALQKLEETRLKTRKAIENATPEKVRAQVESLKKEKEELSETIRNLKSELGTARENIKLYDERIKEMEDDLARGKQAILDNKQRIKEIKTKNQEHEGELRAVLKVEESLSKELADLNKKREKLHDATKDLEHKIETFNINLQTNTSLKITEKSNLKTVQQTLAEAESTIQAFDVKYSDEEVAKFPPTEDLGRTIKDSEGKMERMGEVNMKAIEQYDLKENRKTELDTEKKDLLSRRDELIHLVENFITKKKDGFFKVYDAVNENFGNIYKDLSNGGEARLVLENPDDPFEGGLTIEAKPPGKKVLRIDALSGGEKGVASMAMIFSIQQYMPSPFYLLDEIDQNLDAINSENVARMVKNNSSTAQFVVVSLHKVTLKEADHVYGVTIQKSGITDIIGNVNINDLKDYNEEMNEINKDQTQIEEPTGAG